MKAAVLSRPGQIDVRDYPQPEAGSAALVRVTATGICGTDLKIVTGEIPVATPLVLGHEVIGRIDQPSSKPGALPSGTPVVVDPVVSCGVCDVCRNDLPHLCPRGGLIGRDTDGGFAEFIVVPEARLHAVPPGMTEADAVMLQVLSTCVHAQTRISPGLGSTAVVVGLGVTGLLHVALLAARGVTTIVGVSRSQAKRDLALSFGATVTAQPSAAPAAVAQATRGRGAQIVVECAGTQDSLSQATDLAGLGASVLIFGTVSPAADRMPTYEWYRKELTLLNTRAARPRDISAAIRVVQEGIVRPGRLVTSRHALADIGGAISAHHRPGEVKVTMGIS